ncbi:PAS domain S-box protein [Paraburkholderia kururiensis]|uniref:PAS domain S-box protein n=1 Tax=Paraburkholderia kururiensis TaxID=984307 RepID=UPI00035CDCAF|nr:PAS domain S-box protein [Paraburkholderia kururiensis]
MEEATALSERIIDDMADAMIYANRSGAIARWNRAAEALFGFTAAEALGSRLDLIIPEHLRAAHWRGFDAAMASGTTRLHGRATVTRAVDKSGRKLYVEMSFALVHDPQGAVCGTVAVARDVTARVEQERMMARHGGAV